MPWSLSTDRHRLRAMRGIIALVLLTFPIGCGVPSALRLPRRMEFGQVLVLPGIEGGTVLCRNIALGLNDGGVKSAIQTYDWTVGVPGAFVVNLMYRSRNQRVAQQLADAIVEYHRGRPGRPIHLVGHSGGAGILVFALELLPADLQIDSAILLAPALSPDYDLTAALRHIRFGLINFYSQRDVGFLKAGTTVFGSIDREHGVSAGAVGFSPPAHLQPEDRRLYTAKLRNIGWNDRMRQYGASGSHIGWAGRTFSRRYVAPIVTRNESRYSAPSREAVASPAPSSAISDSGS